MGQDILKASLLKMLMNLCRWKIAEMVKNPFSIN